MHSKGKGLNHCFMTLKIYVLRKVLMLSKTKIILFKEEMHKELYATEVYHTKVIRRKGKN